MKGTGLFLASGQALATGGPVGALFGYIVMSLLTASVALTTGELSSFSPVTGGFIRHATHFIQPAVGAATGWTYCELACLRNISLRYLSTNLDHRVLDGSDRPGRD